MTAAEKVKNIAEVAGLGFLDSGERDPGEIGDYLAGGLVEAPELFRVANPSIPAMRTRVLLEASLGSENKDGLTPGAALSLTA